MSVTRSLRGDPLAELAKRLPPGARVLDVGCGNFQRIYRNLARRRSDIVVTGLEKYEERSIYGPAPIYPPCATDRFRRLTCDVERERFPFDDATFDGAFLSHVIEHVSASDRMLREICRTLRPGGLMYVETPGPNSLMRRPRWLPRAGDTINFYDDPTHIGTPYTFDRLHVELESAGFAVVAQAPFRQLGVAGAPIYLLMMAVGALPILSTEARVFAYGAGVRNLVGWAISVLAQKASD